MNSRIIPSIAILLAIVIFFGYVNPLWTGDIAKKNIEITAANNALVSAADYKKEQNKLISDRDSIAQEKIDRLSVFLPDSVDNVGLIINLNALAVRSGLSVSNIDVITSAIKGSTDSNDGTLPSNSPNIVGSVDLSLSTVGSFSALQKFLTGIERSARILDIHELEVTGSDTGVYSYRMAIRLYWLR